ncbi:hypothetical protein VTN77DRAFT_4089 [Rasamsonia byssochlamydoides]|uniref:uncharacterized protein n=1 Tax=Rasamsonia byssochlamydoides TaxID=89139 RepID=UPI00374404B7
MPWSPFNSRLPWWRAEKPVPARENHQSDQTTSEVPKPGLVGYLQELSSQNSPVSQDPDIAQNLPRLFSGLNIQDANQKPRRPKNPRAVVDQLQLMAYQNTGAAAAAAAVAREPALRSANMRGAQTPYTISSGEWCPTWNPANDHLYLHHVPEKQMKARWESVLSVASIVYAVAKVFLTICQNFGVEVRRVDPSITSGGTPTDAI